MGTEILHLLGDAVEGAALVFVLVWLLPRLGLTLPLAVVIGVMTVWAAWNAITFGPKMRARKMKKLSPSEAMIGKKGLAATPLAPGGIVRVDGELWEAVSADEEIPKGERVMVVAIGGLKLTVSRVEGKG